MKIDGDKDKIVLTDKIEYMKNKLNDRDEQVMKYGGVIEKLNEELKIREDPAKNAIGIVNYLEKYSRYQTDFLEKEVKKYQKDFKKVKDDALKKEMKASKHISTNKDLAYKYETQKNEIKILKEMLDFRESELETLEKEKKTLLHSLESSHKDKKKTEQMTKRMDIMSNQLTHYKSLVKR